MGLCLKKKVDNDSLDNPPISQGIEERQCIQTMYSDYSSTTDSENSDTFSGCHQLELSHYQSENIVWNMAGKEKTKVKQSYKGQLQLSLYINTGHLTVHVIAATHLQSRTDAYCDSYVKVCMTPDVLKRTRCKTELVEDSNNPVYDEKFSFELLDDDEDKRIFLSVWNKYDNLKSCEFLGCMSFGVKTVTTSSKPISGCYYLLGGDIGRTKHLQVAEHLTRSTSVRSAKYSYSSMNRGASFQSLGGNRVSSFMHRETSSRQASVRLESQPSSRRQSLTLEGQPSSRRQSLTLERPPLSRQPSSRRVSLTRERQSSLRQSSETLKSQPSARKESLTLEMQPLSRQPSSSRESSTLERQSSLRQSSATLARQPSTPLDEDPLWTETVVITVKKGPIGYGFSVSGARPVKVCRVERGSHGHKMGLQEKDTLHKVNGINVANGNADSVARIIKNSHKAVELEVHRPHQIISPMNISNLLLSPVGEPFAREDRLIKGPRRSSNIHEYFDLDMEVKNNNRENTSPWKSSSQQKQRQPYPSPKGRNNRKTNSSRFRLPRSPSVKSVQSSPARIERNALYEVHDYGWIDEAVKMKGFNPSDIDNHYFKESSENIDSDGFRVPLQNNHNTNNVINGNDGGGMPFTSQRFSSNQDRLENAVAMTANPLSSNHINAVDNNKVLQPSQAHASGAMMETEELNFSHTLPKCVKFKTSSRVKLQTSLTVQISGKTPEESEEDEEEEESHDDNDDTGTVEEICCHSYSDDDNDDSVTVKSYCSRDDKENSISSLTPIVCDESLDDSGDTSIVYNKKLQNTYSTGVLVVPREQFTFKDF